MSEEEETIALARETLRTHLPLLVGVEDLEPQRDPESRLVRDCWGRLIFEVSDHPHQTVHVGPGEPSIYLHEGDPPDFPFASVWAVQKGRVIGYVPPAVDTRPAPP